MVDTQPFAFVLMPFDEAFDDIYRLGIKAPAEELGILAQRVDEQMYKEGMLERIYNQIAAADMVIADMSGKNPNVFYEVGFAHAKEKLCILLTSNADDIPFDLKHRRHIVYGKSIQKLKKELSVELSWAKQEVENIRDKRIQATLKSCEGILEKTDYSAKAVLNFRVDLKNVSRQSSPEIEMAYFYCGPGWNISQDGKECPSSESDVKGFPARHFITVPVRRIGPHGWAQIQFKSSKYLAFATKGEKLKDEYQITGRSLLRLVTSDGVADYNLLVNTKVDEFPF